MYYQATNNSLLSYISKVRVWHPYIYELFSYVPINPFLVLALEYMWLVSFMGIIYYHRPRTVMNMLLIIHHKVEPI